METTRYYVKKLGNPLWGVVDRSTDDVLRFFVSEAKAQALCDELNDGEKAAHKPKMPRGG